MTKEEEELEYLKDEYLGINWNVHDGADPEYFHRLLKSR
jgi:hypothetical protein